MRAKPYQPKPRPKAKLIDVRLLQAGDVVQWAMVKKASKFKVLSVHNLPEEERVQVTIETNETRTYAYGETVILWEIEAGGLL